MSYNRRNTLLRMKLVVDIYKKHKNDGNTTRWVFKEHIEPYYPISIATLYNYLATPIEKELREIEEQRKTK